MAAVTYRRLFNTRIEHDFYVSGISKDLAVFSTSETEGAMKNSKMQFRVDETGFRVLYRVDESNAPFIDFKDVRLVFGLQIKNVTEFLNITTMLPGYGAGKVVYFNNLNNTETVSLLNVSLIDAVRPPVFTYEFPITATNPGQTGTITVTDQNNNNVTLPPPFTGLVQDSQGRFFYPIDFTKLPKGLYTFSTLISGGGGSATQKIYIDTELAKQGVFGIVDILAKDGTSASFPGPPNERVYKMKFDRRTTRWKYYVVLKTGNTVIGDSVTIEDTDTTSPVYNPGAAQIVFASAGTTTVNGIDTKIFLSNLPAIPFYEKAKIGLDLKKNVTDVIMTDLPSPSLTVISGTATESEIFVFI
jgi:hypothetical protein